MLEEYLKRLESLIAPSNYCKSNFKDKILCDEILINQLNLVETNFNSNMDRMNEQDGENKKVIEDYLNRMGIKDKENAYNKLTDENKRKLYNKILSNHEERNEKEQEEISSNIRSMTVRNDEDNKMNHTSRTNFYRNKKSNSVTRLQKSDDIAYEEVIVLKEKVHSLSIKNMSFRYEIEKYKNKINELTTIIEEKEENINKLEKQRENNNKYLLKLEGMLTSSGRTFNSPFMNKTFNKSTVLKTKRNPLENYPDQNKTELIASERKEVKNIISALIQENDKLKTFQQEVYNISKSYDDINENLLNEIKAMQEIIEKEKKEGSDINGKDLNLCGVNVKSVVDNFERTLEVKQNEYNFLLNWKEQEIQVLHEEVVKLSETVELVKRDRIKDHKLISDKETEIESLTAKIQELTDKDARLYKENLIRPEV